MELGEIGCEDEMWRKLAQDCVQHWTLHTSGTEPLGSVTGVLGKTGGPLTLQGVQQLLAHHSIFKFMTYVSIQYQLYGFSFDKHFFLHTGTSTS